jgi:hypothetical protein
MPLFMLLRVAIPKACTRKRELESSKVRILKAMAYNVDLKMFRVHRYFGAI